MKTITFFNNKGGVGKTSLVYHLAWMYADLGVNVVAADLDPQANLTSMFLDDSHLETLWTEGNRRRTIYGAIQPLLEGSGDVTIPHVEHPSPGLGLVIGDLALSAAEDELSSQWPDCLDRKPRHSGCSRLCGASSTWPRSKPLPSSSSWTSAPTSAHSIGRRWSLRTMSSYRWRRTSTRFRDCVTLVRRCGDGEKSGPSGVREIPSPISTCRRARCARLGTSSCNTRFVSTGR